MKKRLLGNTGIEVSEVAFGGVEIGMPYGIGVNSAEDMLSENEAIHLLLASLDEGINFFDTARMYGNSEAIMGKAFEGRREDVVISSKCRHFRSADGKLPPDKGLKKFITDSLEETLHALKTDYVDIFMLHQADIEILQNETIAEVFTSIKKEGKARAIGASVYSAEQTEKVISSGIWQVVQLPFNLMDQRQQFLFQPAAREGVGIVVRSVLLKGLLSGANVQMHSALYNVQEHIKGYRQLLGEHLSDLPSLALKFALSFDQVSSVLVGMDRMQFLYHALASANGNYLVDDALRKAKELAYPEPAFLDLPYWDKMGWLK